MTLAQLSDIHACYAGDVQKLYDNVLLLQRAMVAMARDLAASSPKCIINESGGPVVAERAETTWKAFASCATGASSSASTPFTTVPSTSAYANAHETAIRSLTTHADAQDHALCAVGPIRSHRPAWACFAQLLMTLFHWLSVIQ